MFLESPYDVNEAGAGSEEPRLRQRFVQQVSVFVSLQLVIAAISVACWVSLGDFKENLEEYEAGCVGIMFLVFPAVLLVVLWPYARHGCFGVICILWHTFFSASLAGCQSAEGSTWSVLYAASFVAIMTLTFACISACTNFDITKYRGFVVILSIGIWCFVILVVLNTVKSDSTVIVLVLGIVGILVFSMLLLYHVQTIMGGSVVTLKTDEVIYAMTLLYLAIVLIYVCLLMLKFL